MKLLESFFASRLFSGETPGGIPGRILTFESACGNLADVKSYFNAMDDAPSGPAVLVLNKPISDCPKYQTVYIMLSITGTPKELFRYVDGDVKTVSAEATVATINAGDEFYMIEMPS